MKTTSAGVLVLLVVVLSPRAVGAERTGSEAWTSMPVPGGLAALAEAAQLPPPVAAERAFADLVRVVHDRPAPETLDAVRSHLAAAGRRPDESDEAVPLPLSADFWTRTVLRREVAPRALAEAILADRQASLLYVGLLALDAPTLAFVQSHDRLAAALSGRHAAVLAAFGRSLAMADRAVRVPGGDDARPLWEHLVGARADAPAEFIEALLARDHGRLAFFYDAVDQLDADRQRFALGLSLAAETRLARFVQLGRTMRDVAPEWRVDQRPFLRPATSPVAVLREVAVTPTATLAPPAGRAFWSAVFDGARRGLGAGQSGRHEDEADAAWLVAQVLASNGRHAAARLDAVLFAQRLIGMAGPTSDAAVRTAVEGRLKFPSLLYTLERMGLDDVDLYAAASVRARELSARGDERLLLQVQGALAVVERARLARALDVGATRRIVAHLIEATDPAIVSSTGLAPWIRGTLLPALTELDAGADGAEPLVLRAMAGTRGCGPASPGAELVWEGRRYRVDPAASARQRVERARRRQGGPTLDDVLAVDERLAGPTSRVEVVADRFAEWAPLIDTTSGWARDLARDLAAAAGWSGDPTGPPSAGTRRLSERVREGLLADVLVALAYAPYLGESSGPARYGGHVARRHDLGVRVSLADRGRVGPWVMPVERLDGRRWHVAGSVLGLDVPLGRLALRRLDAGHVPFPPRLPEDDRRHLVAALAAASVCDLTDRDRDAVRAAIDAGRARVASLVQRPEALGEAAQALGLSHERVHGLRWWMGVGGRDLVERFSLGELLELGRDVAFPDHPAAWGLKAMPRPANAAMPGGGRGGWDAGRPPTHGGGVASEVLLWVGESLARLELPALLAKDVLTYAAQDVLDGAHPAHADDRLAVSVYLQRAPLSRVEDYVSALAADGPLREVVVPGPTERR